MKLLLVCAAFLALALFCEEAMAADECVTYNKNPSTSKMGSCYPNKGFTPNADYIGKEGPDGCKEVCREKGFIDGCCTGGTADGGDQDCWCAVARNAADPPAS